MPGKASADPRVFIQPDVRRKRVQAHVEGPEGATYRLSVDGTDFEVEGPSGALLLSFPEFSAWAPPSPTLYTLIVTPLEGDALVESYRTQFGMREFTAKENRFYLNGRPIYIRGVDYPLSQDFDDGPGAHKVLSLARDAGFNLVRFIGTRPCDAALCAADELGLLAMHCFKEADLSSVGDDVVASRNHASLVAWGTQEENADLERTLRDLDPSRLLFRFCASTSKRGTKAAFMRPYGDPWAPLDLCRVALSAPANRLSESYLEHMSEPEALSLALVEGPAVGAESDGASEAAQSEVVQESPEEGAESVRIQMDALRSNGKVAGYCYGGLFGEGAGGQKALLAAFRSLQVDLRPLIHFDRTNLLVREEVPVTVSLVNEVRLDERVDLSLQVVGPTNQVLWKKKRNVKAPKSGRELWSGSISASGSTGTHRFIVRLFQGTQLLGESSAPFSVFEAPPAWSGAMHVLDPSGRWPGVCAAVSASNVVSAPVHIVPPLAKTIRAYPDNDLIRILGQAHEGAVAIVFSPPDDWNDLAAVVDPGLSASSRSIRRADRAAIPYATLHPVFDGLPVQGPMGQLYRYVCASKSFLEAGDEDICGVVEVSTGETREVEPTILVRRYGSGRIVFTHLEILENLGADPVADRLFVNLLDHFGRRSVVSSGAFAAHQRAVEWLRSERIDRTRRWMVIGPFANWSGEGHEAAYPPEESVDFEATYPGWYRPVSWVPWHTLKREAYALDFQDALRRRLQTASAWETGTAFAYAEFNADDRGEGRLVIGRSGPAKAWLNGELVYSVADTPPGDALKMDEQQVFLKQGKNTLLLKGSDRSGPFKFSVEVVPDDAGVEVSWWK